MSSTTGLLKSLHWLSIVQLLSSVLECTVWFTHFTFASHLRPSHLPSGVVVTNFAVCSEPLVTNFATRKCPSPFRPYYRTSGGRRKLAGQICICCLCFKVVLRFKYRRAGDRPRLLVTQVGPDDRAGEKCEIEASQPEPGPGSRSMRPSKQFAVQWCQCRDSGTKLVLTCVEKGSFLVPPNNQSYGKQNLFVGITRNGTFEWLQIN